MKSFIVAFAFIAAVSAAEYAVKPLEQVRKVQAECAVKLRVPTDILSQLKKFQYPDEPVVADYLECIGKELGLWHPVDGYNVESNAQQYKFNFGVDLEEGRTVFTKCHNDNKVGNDAKSWVIAFQRCIATSVIGKRFSSRP